MKIPGKPSEGWPHRRRRDEKNPLPAPPNGPPSSVYDFGGGLVGKQPAGPEEEPRISVFSDRTVWNMGDGTKPRVVPVSKAPHLPIPSELDSAATTFDNTMKALFSLAGLTQSEVGELVRWSPDTVKRRIMPLKRRDQLEPLDRGERLMSDTELTDMIRKIEEHVEKHIKENGPRDEKAQAEAQAKARAQLRELTDKARALLTELRTEARSYRAVAKRLTKHAGSLLAHCQSLMQQIIRLKAENDSLRRQLAAMKQQLAAQGLDQQAVDDTPQVRELRERLRVNRRALQRVIDQQKQNLEDLVEDAQRLIGFAQAAETYLGRLLRENIEPSPRELRERLEVGGRALQEAIEQQEQNFRDLVECALGFIGVVHEVEDYLGRLLGEDIEPPDDEPEQD
ncbi:hypothetical protein [Actinomadura gamaensis]|uniref:Uncharacterized protein n=1 Tax=Actinomadura gamaensis TaxID=1763541 RepID=A0ABV9TZZ5_9ACTN